MDARLTRAREGISALDLPPAVIAGALRNLEHWLTDPEFAPYVAQIEAMIDAGRFEVLVDAFHHVLPFGTGGRRGAVGVGPNRINRWTIGTSVQGHVDWLRARLPDDDLAVVLAYDVRRFEDTEHVWDPELPNPVLGLTSRDLAELAARIYAANGVEAWILPPGAQRYLSTPELSFAVRALGAQGGLNLSASHNPPDDNGVKVYDARGSQLVPPDDQDLMHAVETVGAVRMLDWDAAVSSGRVHYIGDDQYDRYVATCAALATEGGPREVGILYTPLHGTGSVHRILRAAGFRVAVVEDQAEPDSRFSTVPGHVANPERPEALQLALDQAGDDVDLVLATDPDADRIGAVCRHQGAWRHLSGNDIGVLIVDHLLRRPYDRRPLVVKTEVTSTLVERVARAGGAAVVGDLLVGFKYVGEVLRALEEEGRWGELRAADVQYVAGVEESNGVLLTDAMRDKDAAGGAVVLAEAAAAARARGETLIDVLQRLQREHGYVVNTQLNVRFAGATGHANMMRLMDALRASPPDELAGRAVTAFTDHRDPAGRFGPLRSESDASSRNVLVITLDAGPRDDGARVILRPSGTEPKLKVYVEVMGHADLDDTGRAAVDAEVVALSRSMEPSLTR